MYRSSHNSFYGSFTGAHARQSHFRALCEQNLSAGIHDGAEKRWWPRGRAWLFRMPQTVAQRLLLQTMPRVDKIGMIKTSIDLCLGERRKL